MSFDLAKTAFSEAAAAFRVKDYSTAIDRCLEAQSYMLTVPDSRTNRGINLQFSREIASLLNGAREQQQVAQVQASGGIRRTLIDYERPTTLSI
jgi:hypothetical protein